MNAKEKEWYKKAESAYNEGAKLWNSLPGRHLTWPNDRFAIQYCYHKAADREVSKRGKERIPCCKKCGFPIPGAYDD